MRYLISITATVMAATLMATTVVAAVMAAVVAAVVAAVMAAVMAMVAVMAAVTVMAVMAMVTVTGTVMFDCVCNYFDIFVLSAAHAIDDGAYDTGATATKYDSGYNWISLTAAAASV